MVFKKPLTADKPDVPVDAPVTEHSLRLVVVLHDHPLIPKRQHIQELFQPHLLIAVFPAVQHIHISLREAVLLRGTRIDRDLRPVQIGEPGIILLCPVHSLGAQPHHHPQHSRLRVHVRIPLVSAVAVADTSHARHIVSFVVTAGNPLYENCHLLIFSRKPPPQPVLQCRPVHSACVDLPHCVLKCFQPLSHISSVHAENGLVFARKRVSEPVLQKARGSDDEGILAKIFQHALKLLPDLPRKLAGQKTLPEFSRRLKIPFL